ncbi:MAG TPA: class I SAM-dependent methyltransferase [Candidatus Nanoarchaeia archaeon]|nr:class I SAM-dependent methyltransferase [Candidatus Nanoarchaeia archaeon]
MDVSYEEKYHQLEESYWWFKARRHFILDLLKGENKNSRILELGCSGGQLLTDLESLGFKNVHGLDISNSAIQLCRKRGLKSVQVCDAAKTKFRNSEFDIVIASDILEHIKDERKGLSEWSRILKKNGKLIIFVPAFNSLWSRHDDLNQHYRRYSRKQLLSSLRNQAFLIEESSYWNFFMFIPVALLRLAQKIIPSNSTDDLYTINPIVNNLLICLLKLENFLLKFMKFPFGISAFAIAKKLA